MSVNGADLLLGQLDLVELLHVLLVVLLLELTDEAHLLFGAVGVLLGSILLELHRRLGVQGGHDLLPAKRKARMRFGNRRGTEVCHDCW